MERKGISKKTRFEVFKRDSFTCQYCGIAAPNVVLHVDHIQPVSKGGDEKDITNLITSCQSCNSGKGARELSDDAVIIRRKKQLDELQERREQLEMMMEWQRTLANIDDLTVNEASKFWNELSQPWHFNENGLRELKRTLLRFGLSETLESMRICQKQYLFDSTGNITEATVNKAVDYIARVASSRRKGEQKPYLKDLYYIRGILKNREFYLGYNLMSYLEKAHRLGIDTEELKRVALEARNWTDWRTVMEQIISNKEGAGNDEG
jgi:hypothetical protein